MVAAKVIYVNDRKRTGLQTFLIMVALATLVFWMIFGILVTISYTVSPPPNDPLHPSDPTPFDGIAGGLVIGTMATLINVGIASAYAVGNGLMARDHTFSVPKRNKVYYAVAIGVNLVYLALLLSGSTLAQYLVNTWVSLLASALNHIP